jgi:hypothetical protein
VSNRACLDHVRGFLIFWGYAFVVFGLAAGCIAYGVLKIDNV